MPPIRPNHNLLDSFKKDGVDYFKYEDGIIAGASSPMKIEDFHFKTNNTFPMDDYDYSPVYSTGREMVGYMIKKSLTLSQN